MLALLFGALLGAAQAQDFLSDPVVYAPEVLPEDPVGTGEIRVEGGGALVLEHTSMVAEVHAGLARVTIVQWFHNPYDTPIEATYLLPLPERAAVDTMDLVCGDRRIEGFVAEREAARALYEEAKRDGRKAALLEQQRDNLFTQKVTGICPGETVEVTVQYVEEVDHDAGFYTLSLPMTVGPRFSPPWVEDAAALETPYARTGTEVDVTVYIDEGLPIESLWSDSHDVVVPHEDARSARIELAAGDVVPNRDFALTWSLAGRAPRAAVLAHRPDPAEPGYVALTLEPQILDDLFEARPRELIFVLDSSCSMGGESWRLASETVEAALDQMRPDDVFDLLTFSNDVATLFPHGPQPATPDNVRRARRWLDAAYDGGGTNMERGIVGALDLPGDPERLRLVLFLTDGWIGGEDTMFQLVREHLGDARLFSLGIGANPNRYLLAGLAEMGRGDVTYQLPGTPIEETVDVFYGRIAHPAMSDVRIDWGGAEVSEAYPATIPDLWSGQPLRVVARYAGEGPTEVRVTGVVGRETFEVRVPVELPAASHDHEAVASLWARRKIRDLEWYPRGRSADEVRELVTDVALEHHLVSRYTSLVAVDDGVSACGPVGLSLTVPHVAPAGAGEAGGLGSYGYGYGGGGAAYGSVGYGSFAVRGGSTVQMKSASPAAAASYPMNFLSTRGESPSASSAWSGVGSGEDASVAPSGVVGGGSSSGDDVVLGSFDRSTVADSMRRYSGQLKYCYEQRLKANPWLEGRLELRLDVESGRVVAVEVVKDDTGDDELARCVVGKVKRWTLPAESDGEIVWPVVFRPAE